MPTSRHNVLGVSGGFGHDASACVLSDGRVVAFAEEERLSRAKGAYAAAPVHAVLYCLQSAGLTVDTLDTVAVGWDPLLDPEFDMLQAVVAALCSSPDLRGLPRDSFRFYPHHECHAAMAAAASPHPASAVLVMDGRGETASTSIYRYRSDALELVQSIDVVESLGSFYSAATRFAGFGRGGEGKLMGLAAYAHELDEPLFNAFEVRGEQLHALAPVDRGVRSKSARHDLVRSAWFEFFERSWGPPRGGRVRLAAGDLLRETDRAPDIHLAAFARTVQLELERTVLALAELACAITGYTNLAVSGGVALNCAANGKLRARLGDRLSIHALVGDAGVAIGAAVLNCWAAGQEVEMIGHAYLGPSWGDDELRRVLSRLGLSWQEPDDLPECVADEIARGHTVGWFQGASEAGPRALGHRSILASCEDAKYADVVNRLKRREAWRPLAPSVLGDDREDLFDLPSSPFMIEAANATTLAREALPAVVHVDGSSRVHEPSEWTSRRYLELLEAIGRRTGHAAVLNTSFNVGPEPMVCTPTDAVRTFFGSELDRLVIGPALLVKQ